MPKYARFDHTAAEPQPVISFLDTDLIDYPQMPDAADLIEMPPEQWDYRMRYDFSVEGGQLVMQERPYCPPVGT